ncbi:ABC transporter permease [Capillimicrobium parvum]|uniref:ABC transporter permease n=1 Tax=Capillimicrobium parvum TaxID=2884022 RepID=A0A9E7C107_9ACTN|nr:FtsX-like permease family protein [Capillimicrobium parvum]UGS36975.1 hypothetical protein DSM104329_03387 [Capillimicrobium parvum]
MALRSLDRLALRQMRTRKLRSALTGLGVVLGVGMVFGVLLLVGTIRHTFDTLIDSAWGSSDLIITAQAGGQLPQSALATIQGTHGVEKAGAMVGGVFVRVDAHGRAIRSRSGQMWVAGFDPSASPYDFHIVQGRYQRAGPEVILEKDWASSRGLGLGDRFSVATATGRAQLRVVGIFALSGGASFGGQGLAGIPIAEARRIMHRPAGWDQIAVRAGDRGDVAALRRTLQRALGAGAQVKSPQELGDDVGRQLDALNVVLYFFSGVALFVGGFLILNSFNMTVLHRIRELGTLRTLGATRGTVVRTVLVEALVVGVAGTLVGLLLGLGLALALIAAMRGFGLPVGGLSVGAGALIAAIVVGLVVTLVAAIWPARRAGRVEPIRAVLGGRDVQRRPSPVRALAGVALFLPGCILGGRFWMGGGNTGGTLSALLGIAMTMGMFAGIAMTAPYTVMPILRLLAVPLRRLSPTGGRLAIDSATGNPARTAATAAALTIGLSVFVVNSVFTSSFLGTVRDQIDRGFARDLTVQAIGGGLATGEQYPIAPSLRERLARLPEAGVVTPVRARLVHLPGTRTTAANGLAVGVDPAEYGKVDRSEIGGAPRADALAGLGRGGVIVAAAYADEAGLRVGDVVTLHSGAGATVRAPVVGELRTLTEFGGMVMQMSLATMDRVYGPTDDVQLAIKARSPGQAPALRRKVDAIIARDHPNLELLSTTELRQKLDDQVKQQFALFNGILVIAVLVSLLGVVNTLAMSVIERTREIGVLRALGSSRWLVRSSLVDESLLLTLAGAVVGVLSGLVIGVAWIAGLGDVLPGITFRFPVGATLIVAAVAVALGVLAAVLPARRAARVDVIRALTYE